MRRIEVYVPVPADDDSALSAPAARLPSLDGRVIALMSNGKPMAAEILDVVKRGVHAAGGRTARFPKAYASIPAEPELLCAVADHADGAVGALGD